MVEAGLDRQFLEFEGLPVNLSCYPSPVPLPPPSSLRLFQALTPPTRPVRMRQRKVSLGDLKGFGATGLGSCGNRWLNRSRIFEDRVSLPEKTFSTNCALRPEEDISGIWRSIFDVAANGARWTEASAILFWDSIY
ncbi:hypothetical protein NDU88_004591 [Pleurodeles waltl]|uniref:Uncharacterized protein n=1 Tax=Pleurodeles waltl TaxID=8319 RepID=A0AAV7QIV9_PLEWA|nr:hypothetical protein NDU88_004591 [Pleurodeles waltl]